MSNPPSIPDILEVIDIVVHAFRTRDEDMLVDGLRCCLAAMTTHQPTMENSHN